MRGRILAALLAAAAAAGAWLALAPGARRPDIVLLLWDTTRADRLSAYGYRRETTPWLASVAAAGVLYEQCRAPAPWTVPSHASLFTGLAPSAHGCFDLASPLAPSHETLAERLRGAGYDTILVSANSLVGREMGLAQGFDAVRPVPSARADEALALLRGELAARRADPRRASRPLFLFVNLMEPHLPYDPPEGIERPWRPSGATEAEVAAARAFRSPLEMEHNLGVRPAAPATLAILPGLYDGEIRDLDDRSRLLEGILAEAGVLGRGPDGRERDAILAVTSDHGENLNEHGLLDHKLSVSDHLLRVPLVLRWPGRIGPGRAVRDQVRLQDLFPTLLEAAGVAPPARDHAASLLSAPLPGRLQVSEFPAPLAFLGEMRRRMPGEPPARLAPFEVGLLAATGPEEGGRRLKWEGRRRAGPGGRVAEAGERLFDLIADPGETRDLLAAPAPDPADFAAARALRAAAAAWTGAAGD